MRLLLPLAFILMAAAPPAPVVAYDPASDFSRYHSYSWVYQGAPAGMDLNLYQQIRVAVDRSLRARGFVQSNDGDFAVAFTLGPRASLHASDFGHYAPYYGGNEAAGHQMWVNRELADRSTHEHTLAIDIYDNYSKGSVWHGLAPHPILPQTRQSIVEHQVNDVLSLFPPKRQ